MNRRRVIWGSSILIFVLALLVLVNRGDDNNASNGSSGKGTTPNQTTANRTVSPTPTLYKVGQKVQVGTTWEMSIDQVKTAGSNQYISLPDDEQFIIISVTITNISKQEQNYVDGFLLRSDDGYTMKPSYYTDTNPKPEGSVEPGKSLRGDMVYAIPIKTKKYTYRFDSYAGSAIWTVIIPQD